jgi:hypothetical protein
MVITDASGNQVDLTTGQVVGAAPSAKPQPLVAGRTPEGVPARDTKLDIAASSPMDAIAGLIKNLSWGFNSALFALPDAAYKKLASAYGLKEDQITSITNLFNQGEQTPRNASERFARAVGDGIGTTLPFTGILGAAAAARPVVTLAAAPQAGVKGILKGIADDTLNYIKANPVKAAAADIAFGSAYEGLKQAVQEGIDDDNPNKELLKEYLPAAAFLGPVAWYTLSPTRNAASFVKNKMSGAGGGAELGSAQKEALDSLPAGYRLPIINIFPKVMLKRAEQKLVNVFGPIAESTEAKDALAQLQAALNDPRVAEHFLINGQSTLDAAEQTMYGPLLAEKAKILNQLGPAELTSIKARIAENQQRFTAMMESFKPEARRPIEEAFRAAQADRQGFFTDLLRQQKDLTAAEVEAISQRLGPQDINNLNDELRGVIAGGMEMDAQMRTKVLNRMGLRQGTTPDGLPMPTRAEGKSLFPARDMEAAATALVDKYKIERPSLRAAIPEPIQLLDRFLTSQQITREKMERDMMGQLVDQNITEQMANFGTALPADFQKALRSEIMRSVRGESAKGGRGKRAISASDLASKPDAAGNITIPSGIPGKKFTINPEQIKADAKKIAEANTQIDINLPEALDYLSSAQRFRNDSLFRYNRAMQGGRMRLTDADRYLKTGDAVYKDIESLILNHVPKIQEKYQGMKSVLDDYRAGYEQALPLLISQKTRGGESYLLPNEALMQKAFSSAENLKQLQLTLGNSSQAPDLLKRGAIDWLRTKGVVNQEGLIDPRKIRSVLDKNQNIVNALPADIQAQLKNEVGLAEGYVTRLGELDQRMVIAKDAELDTLLRKGSRPDADTGVVMAKALQDPASMRTLVNHFSNDPDSLAALRRSVYDMATQGAEKGGALAGFLQQNEKSLKVLFGGTQHFDDLKILADMQRRVNAFADVTGQIPVFEATDDKMKRLFGFGIQFATTTAREAAVGRISPETGALALMLRLGGKVESQLYQRMFTKALEDPKFASSITHVGTPQQAATVNGMLQNIGIDLTKVYEAPRARAPTPTQRVIKQEAAGALQPEQEARPAPQPTAEQMLRALPPAPATRGYTSELRVGPPPAIPAGGAFANVPLMYPAMFPNDPISGLLKARQDQILGRQQGAQQ